MPLIQMILRLTNKRRIITLLCHSILATTLVACGTQIQPQENTAQLDINMTGMSSDALLDAANQANATLLSPERENKLILIAQQLFDFNDTDNAGNVISNINQDLLTDDNYPSYVITASKIHLTNNVFIEAKEVLETTRLNNHFERFTIEEQQTIHQLKADFYRLTGDIVASLNEYILLSTLLTETEAIHINNNAIWQQLSTLTTQELELLEDVSDNSILKDWFNLAITSKSTQNSLQLQYDSILSWVSYHPNHPASQRLPDDLASLERLIQTSPKHIALLLPLKGQLAKAGQAIRDGFLAAYYHQGNKQYDKPDIRFYDTADADINIIYEQAANNGAEVIIGPLEKEAVFTLAQRETFPVPTLALNYSETSINTGSRPLYQFGLALEDEARQVAERAWLEGHRNALIISSENNWSKRAADAFSKTWLAYGGIIIEESVLNKSSEYSDNVEGILHINQSKQRARDLKRLFGRNFEFEPRRRHDIDMIFMIARSQEARQIKPILNFHYAGDIPVYATSQIYKRNNSPSKNSDLNNIRLTTLPWVLNSDIAERELIEDNLTANINYESLYALGVDSFLLYPRLEQLYRFNTHEIYGTTGQLSIDQNKRVVRKQLWAQIQKGELQPLRALTLSTNDEI